MPREKITRYQHVRDILDRAAGNGHPSHGGNGRFWNKPLQEFMQLRINTIPVIATPGANRGARSGLILGLKGEPPFGDDDSDLPRMPLFKPPVAPADIAFIEKWIDDDCPDEPMGLIEP
jgi:tyrosinase